MRLRADDKPKRKLLVYTRSQTFEHSVVRPAKGKTKCLVEEVLTDLGSQHNFEITHTKDGRIFLPDSIKQFDAFLFETTGDLTAEGGDKQPPMPPEGKTALLNAIAAGKGFVGCHCASDTFHSPGHFNGDFKNQQKLDPYIEMLGGEFIRHGGQQKAWMRVIDKQFPGVNGLADFQLNEEWYSLKNFSPDIHVILVQDNKGMHGRRLPAPGLPGHLGPQARRGPRLLYVDGPPRRRMGKQDVSATAGGRSGLRLWRCRRRPVAQSQDGRALRRASCRTHRRSNSTPTLVAKQSFATRFNTRLLEYS